MDSGTNEEVKSEGKRVSAAAETLPSILLSKVQSLRNKMDELPMNVKHILEYRNACVIAMTETWLKDYNLNHDFDINGFGQLYR